MKAVHNARPLTLRRKYFSSLAYLIHVIYYKAHIPQLNENRIPTIFDSARRLNSAIENIIDFKKRCDGCFKRINSTRVISQKKKLKKNKNRTV